MVTAVHEHRSMGGAGKEKFFAHWASMGGRNVLFLSCGKPSMAMKCVLPLLLDTSNNSTTCNNTEEEKIHWSFTESFLCAYPQGKVCGNTFKLDVHYRLQFILLLFYVSEIPLNVSLIFVQN